MDAKTFLPDDYPIVLFDSQCLICDSFIQWILKKDKKQRLKFSGLQTDKSLYEISKRRIPLPDFGSVILLYKDQYFIESDAVIEILKILEQSVLARLVKLFPKPRRDAFYNWVARNRYRIFRKKDQCLVPDPSQESRFL